MVDKSSRAGQARIQCMRRVGLALRELVSWSEQASAFAAKQLRLHPTDLTCIGYLIENDEPVSPKQIISHLGLSSGSGTALLDRLEGHGFIRRIPNPSDRRSVLIEVDREKAEVPIAFYRKVRQAYGEVMDQYSDEELRRIAEFLEAVSAVQLKTELETLAAQLSTK